LTAKKWKGILMPMHVSTLEILEKRFPPEDARAIALAIEEETNSLTVTLATNDSLKMQLAELEARLFTKIAALGLTGAGLIISAVFFLLLNFKR
jgi:hypothetical protein